MQLGLAGALTLLALAPVIAAYYEARSDHALVRSREDIVWYSAHGDSYLQGAGALTLWGDTLSRVEPEHEHLLAVGDIVLIISETRVVTRVLSEDLRASRRRIQSL